jgi:circadian clock protein KaiB
MRKQRTTKTTRRFERALTRRQEDVYILRLYVAGATPASQRAIENVKNLCEQCLKGHYHLEVVDIYQQPELAKGVQIVAAPTLIRVMPAPLRRFIGDMTKAERVLLGMT